MRSTPTRSRFSLLTEQLKRCLDPTACRHSLRSRRSRRHAGRISNVQDLESRLLLAVTPAVAVNAPGETFIGESFDLQLSFDNTGTGAETGYGPIIDVILPVNGADGAAGTSTADGFNTTGSATYLGASVTTIDLTFPDDGGGTGSVQHPYFVDASGAPLTVSGTAGDKLVVIELPFGSFTPDQPAATVVLPVQMSNLADLGTALDIRARAGFRFGTDPLDNPASDPSLLSPGDASADSSTWTEVGSTTPILVQLEKRNLADEQETATGPNFVQTYEIALRVAEGQTITNFDITDLLPPELVYVGDASVSFTAGSGATVSGMSIIDSPPADFSPHAAPDNDLVVRFNSVTGGTNNSGLTLTFDFYVNEFNAAGASVLPPSTADDFVSQNEAFAIGDWTPIDGRDAGGTDNVVAHENVAGPDDDLEDQSIAVQKSLIIHTDNGAAGFTPGDVLEYTLQFQVSDYFAFEDVNLTDLLSDGQRLDDSFTPRLFVQEHGNTSSAASFAFANFTVADNFSGLTDAGVAAGSGPSHVVDGSVPVGSQELRFRISDELTTRGGTFADGQLVGGAIPDGGTGGPDPDAGPTLPFGATLGTIVYRVIVQDRFSDDFPSGDRSVDEGDTLSNSAVIDGAVLNFSDLTANGNREADDTAESFEIERGSLTKSIYAVNGSTSFSTPVQVAPGDTVTYRFMLTLPSTDIEDLAFVDYLPLPVFDALEVNGPFTTTISATPPAAGHAKYGPAESFYPISVALGAGFGLRPTISRDASANSVTFTYGDYDSPLNTATVIDILFTVTVSDDPFADGLFLTNQVRQVEDSTNAGSFVQDAIVQLELTEPDLEITKGVVSNGNSSGTYSPGTVGPVSFSGPGGGDNNVATAEFSGTINSTNLAATPIDSNLAGIDGGELVKFAIVIENVGSSRNGAFDVQISDSLPAGFSVPGSGLNLSVTDGTGAAVAFTDLGGGLFGSGLRLDDGATGAIAEFDATSGTNIVVITYDLQADADIQLGSTNASAATVDSYAGAEGAANHVPGGLSDAASVTVASPTVTKTIVSTSQAHTTGNDVAIGEIIRYRVDIDIPEGTLTAASFVDTLDAG
ncbi:MAG: hypothetical protein R3C19_23095, partial [Planctomycetaceae bacterium]